METKLVTTHNNKLVVNTFSIFSGLGYAGHRELKKVIWVNKEAFLTLGTLDNSNVIVSSVKDETLEGSPSVAFRKKGRPDSGYLLNFRQYTLLVMIAKNSPESLGFKMALESEFNRLREGQLKPNSHIEAIRKLLMLDTPDEWVKLFPDDYYIALMKLYGQEFKGNKSTPPYCAQITRRWIYDKVIPKELNVEISTIKGDEKKHQWFSKENGRASLLAQINQVTAIARISFSRSDFESKCASIYENAPLQLSVFT